MADRITITDLERQATRINVELGRPTEAYRVEAHRPVAQVGCFHIEQAYGKVALCEMWNESGGTRNVLGFCTKRDLHDQMFALREGIRLRDHQQACEAVAALPAAV